MAPALPGIHHVTAIAGDAQRNVDFYAGILGLRLVKHTVNFDDPSSIHLYYGDEIGHPGTIMTFFIWPGASRGRPGRGQVTATAFSVPPGSLSWWRARLVAAGVDVPEPLMRFGDAVVAFPDPDGLPLELVEPTIADDRVPWTGGPVPAERAIRGVHGVTLTSAAPEETELLLADSLGLRGGASAGDRTRFRAGDAPGGLADVRAGADELGGVTAVGTVHHVAWRCPDTEAQLAWRERLTSAGLDVTPVRNRTYFRSIYFREPGGVLFEIATDEPGFTVDEPRDRLGLALQLPRPLEARRQELERTLPPFHVPTFEASAS